MTAADLHWFSDTVRTIYAARTHGELHERVLARLHPWFHSRVTACESSTHDGTQFKTHQLLGEAPAPPDYFLYVWDNPNVVRLLQGDRSPVLQIRENTSAQGLQRTAWFNNIARLSALQDQMVGIVWGRSWFTSFGLNRDRAFTARERDMFQLLHGHLQTGLCRVNAPPLSLAEWPDTPWIALTGGQVSAGLTGAQAARLGRYFPDWRPQAHGLPAAVLAWLGECRKRTAALPHGGGLQALWVDSSHGRLGLRYFPETGGEGAMIRLVELPWGWGDFMASSGLTPREAEVLGWLAQGKRNAEIAAILGVSVFTVGKHVEHVLKKLGVTNRAAAVSVGRAQPPARS